MWILGKCFTKGGETYSIMRKSPCSGDVLNVFVRLLCNEVAAVNAPNMTLIVWCLRSLIINNQMQQQTCWLLYTYTSAPSGIHHVSKIRLKDSAPALKTLLFHRWLLSSASVDGWGCSSAGNNGMETGMDFANRSGLLSRYESTSANEGGGIQCVFIELVLLLVLITGGNLPA